MNLRENLFHVFSSIHPAIVCMIIVMACMGCQNCLEKPLDSSTLPEEVLKSLSNMLIKPDTPCIKHPIEFSFAVTFNTPTCDEWGMRTTGPNDVRVLLFITDISEEWSDNGELILHLDTLIVAEGNVQRRPKSLIDCEWTDDLHSLAAEAEAKIKYITIPRGCFKPCKFSIELVSKSLSLTNLTITEHPFFPPVDIAISLLSPTLKSIIENHLKDGFSKDGQFGNLWLSIINTSKKGFMQSSKCQ